MTSAPVVLVALPGLFPPAAVAGLAGIDGLATTPGPERSSAAEWADILDRAGRGVVVATADSLHSVEARRTVRRRARVIWITDSGLVGGVDRSTIRRCLGPLTTTAGAVCDLAGRTGDAAATVRAAIEAAPVSDRSPHRTESVSFVDGRSYDIHVGRGSGEQVAKLLPDRARRVAVLTQDGIGLEVDTGREQRTFRLPAGESAKTLAVVEDVCSRLARWGMTRADAVVTVGGGVVSDVGGYVAASYHRGVPVVHVSTTLLGQIDAAIGGKCGVNLPEGKNLVGAFWQPSGVVCEIEALDTLPEPEFVSGMGELAKYHFLGGGRLDRLALVDRVAASARIKADVVSGDEREGGRRAVLNYGHTLAHALEASSGYRIRHGEAVALGLVYAAEVAYRLGRIDQDRVNEHRRVVAGYGLATTVPELLAGSSIDGFDADRLLDLFARDKKAVDGVTFVLDGAAGVEPVRVDDRQLLRDALHRLESP